MKLTIGDGGEWFLRLFFLPSVMLDLWVERLHIYQISLNISIPLSSWRLFYQWNAVSMRFHLVELTLFKTGVEMTLL